MDRPRIDVVYGRVSSPQPDPLRGTGPRHPQQEASLEKQCELALDLRRRLGFTGPVLCITDDCSGANRDRPGFQRVKRLISQGGVRVLFLYDDSRAARDQLLFRQLMNHCFNFHTKVGIYTLGRLVDWTNPNDRALLGQRAYQNEQWLRDHVRIITDGLKRARDAGRPLGTIPFGYRRMPEGKRGIVLDEAVVVRRIFEELAAGETTGMIARRLELDRRAGLIPGPRRYLHWTESAVKAISQNPLYVGDTVLNWRCGRPPAMDPSGVMRVIPNTHDAIIPRALYDCVRRRFPHRAGREPAS